MSDKLKTITLISLAVILISVIMLFLVSTEWVQTLLVILIGYCMGYRDGFKKGEQ